MSAHLCKVILRIRPGRRGRQAEGPPPPCPAPRSPRTPTRSPRPEGGRPKKNIATIVLEISICMFSDFSIFQFNFLRLWFIGVLELFMPIWILTQKIWYGYTLVILLVDSKIKGETANGCYNKSEGFDKKICIEKNNI